jgi:hypothetical protein
MGCCGSKSSAREISDWELIYQKFENVLPFCRTRIDIFEGKVKRYVVGKTGVSFA